MALSQNQAVLEYITTNGSIDTYRAVRDLGVYRLSARIKNLRDLGFPVKSVCRKKILDGKVVNHWAEYYLGNDTSSNQTV